MTCGETEFVGGCDRYAHRLEAGVAEPPKEMLDVSVAGVCLRQEHFRRTDAVEDLPTHPRRSVRQQGGAPAIRLRTAPWTRAETTAPASA